MKLTEQEKQAAIVAAKIVLGWRDCTLLDEGAIKRRYRKPLAFDQPDHPLSRAEITKITEEVKRYEG